MANLKIKPNKCQMFHQKLRYLGHYICVIIIGFREKWLSILQMMEGILKDNIMVDRPMCLQVYNDYMGGVDKLDFLISLYRIQAKTSASNIPLYPDCIKELGQRCKYEGCNSRSRVKCVKSCVVLLCINKNKNYLLNSRDEVYRARTKLKTCNKERQDKQIFINDELTPRRAKLLFEARALKRSKKIADCWTAYGKVMVKDFANKVFEVKSSSDLLSW